jgi:hypothetical protein
MNARALVGTALRRRGVDRRISLWRPSVPISVGNATLVVSKHVIVLQLTPLPPPPHYYAGPTAVGCVLPLLGQRCSQHSTLAAATKHQVRQQLTLPVSILCGPGGGYQ